MKRTLYKLKNTVSVTLASCMKKTRPAPAAVRPHVMRVPRRAWYTGPASFIIVH